MNNLNCNRVLDLCVGAALLAGCGGAQPPLVARGAPLQAQMRSSATASAIPALGSPGYKTTGPLLYVVSYDETLTPLRIYNADAKDPKPIAQISKDIDNSGGACIDGDGTLYVTNDASAGWVSEYALGRTRPVRVITKGINTPAYCAIDASGNLWVTNIGFDDVAEYLKGATKPHATITEGLTYPDGIAVDDAGNLYVGNPEPFNAPNIQVYARGSKSPSRTITDGVTWPVGMAVDSHDTLYVANFHAGGTEAPGNIEEYRFGQSTPYRTVTDKLVNPANIALDKNGRLYVADWPDNTSSPYVIIEFAPHSLKASSRKITQGVYYPQGLAYYPTPPRSRGAAVTRSGR